MTESENLTCFDQNKCTICFRVLLTQGNLERHYVTVHKEKLTKSEIKAFYESEKFSESVHEKKKLFQCSKCDFRSGLTYNLIRHYDTVHEKKKSIPCTACNRCFTQKSDLKRHYATVHKEKVTQKFVEPNRIECSICFQVFRSKCDLENHYETFHEEEKSTEQFVKSEILVEPERSNDSEIVVKLEPEIKPEIFIDIEEPDLSNDVSTVSFDPIDIPVHEENRPKIEQTKLVEPEKNHESEKFVRSEPNIKSEIFSDIQKPENNETVQQFSSVLLTAECSICNTTFTSKKIFKRHIAYCKRSTSSNLKGTTREFECPFCRSGFVKKQDVTRHISLLHDEYVLPICPFCNSKFRKEWQLNKHMKRAHEEEKSTGNKKTLQCTKCDTKFKLKKKLAIHFGNFHIKKKGYLSTSTATPTTATPKFFSSIQVNVVHSLPPKNECQICEAKFHLENDLNRHLIITHSINPFDK